VTTDYDYVGDRLLTATASAAGQTTTSTFSYDDFGNTTKIVSTGAGQTTTVTHDYDEFGRRTLSDGEGAEGAGELYTYDGLDRRIRREEDGATSRYIYDYAYVGVSEKLSSERARGSDPTSGFDARYYDYDSRGNRLGQEARAEAAAPSGEFEPYETDPQGTVLGLENDAGVIEAGKAYEYDPYGQLLNEDEINEEADVSGDEAAVANPFRFQGHYYDQGTDVYGMQARSYLPSVGRFMGEDRYEAAGADLALQSDPLTQSRYVFAGGNPVSRVEWDGHWTKCETCSPRQQNRMNTRTNRARADAYQAAIAEENAELKEGLADVMFDRSPPPLQPQAIPMPPESRLQVEPSHSNETRLRAAALYDELFGLSEKQNERLSSNGRLGTCPSGYSNFAICGEPGLVNTWEDLTWVTGGPGGALLKGGRGATRLFGGLSASASSGMSLRQAAQAFLSRGTSSPWRLPPAARGLAIEAKLGGNLPSGFPTIDRFSLGTATSIKSIDLAATTYQSASRLSSRLKTYVDSVARFEGAARGGRFINPEDIVQRELVLAIRPGAATAAQQRVLSQMGESAMQRGVNLRVVEVP
jgi:RHS repeat-associated protein